MSESEKDKPTLQPPSPDPAVSERTCAAPAPDRSGRTCDKPRGHDGEHWTYGGFTKRWPADPAVSVELATADLKRAALEWEGESYDEAVAPAVQALILAVRAASPRIREEEPCRFKQGRCTVCGEPESGMCNRPDEPMRDEEQDQDHARLAPSSAIAPDNPTNATTTEAMWVVVIGSGVWAKCYGRFHSYDAVMAWVRANQFDVEDSHSFPLVLPTTATIGVVRPNGDI